LSLLSVNGFPIGYGRGSGIAMEFAIIIGLLDIFCDSPFYI